MPPGSSATEPPTSTSDAVRVGYVRHQQELAHRALARGHVGAARLSLRVLRATDFDEDVDRIDRYLAVMRDVSATDDAVIDAAMVIIRFAVRAPPR